MYELILFDLDGTLTDPKVGITKSVRYALDSFGIETKDLDSLVSFIGPPLRESFQRFYGFSVEQAAAAVVKYREYFAETGIFENVPYPGIVELLARLKADGARLAVATSKPTVFARQIAEHFGFEQYFDVIAGSELDDARSRKGEVIAYALEAFPGYDARRAVMTGDREHDIIGAGETGLDSIGVLWGYGSRGELQTAGATHIVKTPEELYALLRA